MSNNSKNAQQTFCPNFDEYMEDMEQDMQHLVMKPTNKRLKIIVMASKDAMNKLLALLDDNADDFECYKIPQKMYHGFQNHVYSLLKKKCTKGVNFGRVKTKKNYTKIWGLFKGYWFHNAPKEMSRYLWVPLLTNIAKYFNRMAALYASTNSSNWDESVIETFLKLRFVKNIFEVKCQINSQSNPGGPVIQFAVWKIPSMQNVLNRNFDGAFSTRWASWLSHTRHNGMKMRINRIVKELVKPYAHERFQAFCVSNDIASQAMLSALDVTEHQIEKMTLSRYFCTTDIYSTSASDPSLSETKESAESVDETVSTEDTNDSEDMIITNGYGGYHGASNTHSHSRSRPYPDDRARFDKRNPATTNHPQSSALKDVKCATCRKCKYHCRCRLYDPMWQQWMQHRWFFQRYGYLMSSLPPIPSQYMLEDNTNVGSSNYDMKRNEVHQNDPPFHDNNNNNHNNLDNDMFPFPDYNDAPHNASAIFPSDI